jgi:cytochrome P450
VGAPAYAIHRNPEYFPEPNTFYPERWLAPDSSQSSSPNIPRTQEAISLARRAFISFSQGSRGCIGRQLAYYELHTALALVLHRFDIRLAQDPLTQQTMDDSMNWREGFPDDLSAKRVGADRDGGRRKEGEFQLFDHFLSDRNGPMVEFRERVQ